MMSFSSTDFFRQFHTEYGQKYRQATKISPIFRFKNKDTPEIADILQVSAGYCPFFFVI